MGSLLDYLVFLWKFERQICLAFFRILRLHFSIEIGHTNFYFPKIEELQE